jgi:2-dehydro-3-deoxygluconokinase
VLVAFDPNIRVSLWPDRDKLIQALSDATSVSDIVLPMFSDEATLLSDISQE